MRYYTQDGFTAEVIEKELNLGMFNYDIDVRDRMEPLDQICTRIKAYISEDHKTANTDSDIDYIVVPNGITSTVLTRMFGERGEDVPKFLPMWIKEKLTPKVKLVKTSFVFISKVNFRRACPHVNEKTFTPHDNFIRYGDLSSGEDDIINNIKESAEYDCYDQFRLQIHKLMVEFTQISGNHPTRISIGNREETILNQNPMFRDGVIPSSEIKNYTFMGLKVDKVNKSTYLAIY